MEKNGNLQDVEEIQPCVDALGKTPPRIILSPIPHTRSGDAAGRHDPSVWPQTSPPPQMEREASAKSAKHSQSGYTDTPSSGGVFTTSVSGLEPSDKLWMGGGGSRRAPFSAAVAACGVDLGRSF